jgi:hypothetical protein
LGKVIRHDVVVMARARPSLDDQEVSTDEWHDLTLCHGVEQIVPEQLVRGHGKGDSIRLGCGTGRPIFRKRSDGGLFGS